MTSTLKRVPVPGEVIEPIHKKALLQSLSRVLYVNEKADRIVVITIAPRRSKGRLYFVGPMVKSLSLVMTDIDKQRSHIKLKGVTPRPDVASTDVDLDKKYLRHGQTISNIRSERAERYELIKPLVEDYENRNLLFDPQIRQERISVRANAVHDGRCSLNRTKKKITEILNQYFSEGSTPGAVTPFSGAKGGRGKERAQVKKIGRHNTPTKNGKTGVGGCVMTEANKDICGFCWRNYYIRGKTIAKALRRMWREFYSNVELDERGRVQHKLLPVSQRPTRSQFEDWGKKRSPGHESWKKQLTKFNLNRLGRILFGTSDQDIVAVGQRGAVDSTSVDIEFVSTANRLERIGSAHRILIVDGLYGYISGFYLGLEAPSAMTVKLAFLHSLTDKTEWLKWLGLSDQDPLNWIAIRYGSVLADNTDLRCDAVINDLHSIGTGIKFVGVARSDLNSAVESSHHILHRMVDHNLWGTTHGQRHERGEEHADILARHTVVEAIRETARAVYANNTMELDIRPTLELRRDLVENGIKLTRANLTRWAISRGKRSTSLIGEDEARTKLLLPIRGTFTPHGIKLLRSDAGRKREFVEPIRYISRHPLIIERVMKSKVERQRVQAVSFDDDFLHDPYKPTEIFFRNKFDGELIRLELATKDNDLPFECCLADIVDLMNRDALYLYDAGTSRSETLSELEAAQELTKKEASEAYQEVFNQQEKPPSKASLRSGKKENREHEKDRYQYGMPVQTPNVETVEAHSETTGRPNTYSSAEKTEFRDVPPEPQPSSKSGAADESEIKEASKGDSSVLLAAILKRRERANQHVH